jgi:hypothetical protein
VSVYKLAGTGAGGTENGLAQLDVQFDGIITAIFGSIDLDAAANGNEAVYEASFLSVNTIGTNDTRGSLFQIRSKAVITAAGTMQSAENVGIGGLAITVNAGERLWLHAVVTAAIVSEGAVFIYVEDGQAVPTAQRRR